MHAIMGNASEDSEAHGKIQHIEAEVARLSSIITQLMSGTGHGREGLAPLGTGHYPMPPAVAPMPVSFDRARAKMVRKLIRHRRKREQKFALYLLADPGWDMLLDLYAAFYEDQDVGVSSLCIAAAVPATTALRWIRTMEEEGHFVRSQDPNDGRRIFIRLSDAARKRMDEYFDELDD